MKYLPKYGLKYSTKLIPRIYFKIQPTKNFQDFGHASIGSDSKVSLKKMVTEETDWKNIPK